MFPPSFVSRMVCLVPRRKPKMQIPFIHFIQTERNASERRLGIYDTVVGIVGDKSDVEKHDAGVDREVW